MASCLNKVQLIGNLGRDPEIRTLSSGSEVVSFTVAVSERWKDKSGEWKEITEWVACTSFVPGIVNLAKNLHKGSKVYVEGVLQTRKFTDRDGNERQVTEIALKQFGGTLIPLDPRGGATGGEPAQAQQRQQANGRAATQPVDEFDDQIPF